MCLKLKKIIELFHSVIILLNWRLYHYILLKLKFYFTETVFIFTKTVFILLKLFLFWLKLFLFWLKLFLFWLKLFLFWLKLFLFWLKLTFYNFYYFSSFSSALSPAEWVVWTVSRPWLRRTWSSSPTTRPSHGRKSINRFESYFRLQFQFPISKQFKTFFFVNKVVIGRN